MNFGKDFYWGASTASYQIEGGREDGKSDSIWDTFSHKKGAVKFGDNGDIACDSYHRADEDIALLQGLGANAYRFSLAWTRILPDGTGNINQKGADYYSRLIDGLLKVGITPFITLYHWDLPQILQNRGGFLNPEIADWFTEFAEAVKKLYGDRVKHFFTINEPPCVMNGYAGAGGPPEWHLSVKERLTAVHNLLLAHGSAARVLKTISGAEVGYAACGASYLPATESKEDIEAARQKLFACNPQSTWSFSLYSDPIFTGKYPEEWYALSECDRPEISDADMKLISEPLDFAALNLYGGQYVRLGGDGGAETVPHRVGMPRTLIGWEITPEVLYWTPKFFWERYGKKIYISENGMSCHDFVFSDGKVHDPHREEYLKEHLRSLKRLQNEGEKKIAGYLHWSLLDNFEWAEGYSQRFGLVYVDYPTGNRTPKDSYFTYKRIIENNGEEL